MNMPLLYRRGLQLSSQSIAYIFRLKTFPAKYCSSRSNTTATKSDFYLPNPKWPKDAVKVFDELNKLTEDGSWVKHDAPIIMEDEQIRPLIRACDSKMFTGALFFNVREKLSKGVMTFQGWTEGGKGHVHGGAVATIFDSAMGVLSNRSCGTSVTANLSVDYKSRLPLFTTVYIESKVESIDNRKIYLCSSMKSVDGQIEYATSTSLYILVNLKS